MKDIFLTLFLLNVLIPPMKDISLALFLLTVLHIPNEGQFPNPFPANCPSYTSHTPYKVHFFSRLNFLFIEDLHIEGNMTFSLERMLSKVFLKYW